MHICIAAPIATHDVSEFLIDRGSDLPQGYVGAPLTAVLIGELLKLGHKVTAITTDKTLFNRCGPIRAEGKNFTFYVCPRRPRAWRMNGIHLGAAVDAFNYERKQLKGILEHTNPDIIHAHWSYEFALAALSTKIPHLITCHDDPAVVLKYNFGPYRMVRYMMAKRVFYKGKNFTTVSSYMANALSGQLAQSPDVIPNPLASYVLKNRVVRMPTNSRKIAMACNSWDARKNPKLAIQAFVKFRNTNPSAELHLFGDDYGIGQSAHKWCNTYAINEGVFFHGKVHHKLLIKELEGMDALLHPSLEESFGVIIAEAMALGLPIVAGIDSGAVPWVVGHAQEYPYSQCALLTDVKDVDSIYMTLENIFDRGYSDRSRAGMERAKKLFAPENIARLYCEAYQKILNG